MPKEKKVKLVVKELTVDDETSQAVAGDYDVENVPVDEVIPQYLLGLKINKSVLVEKEMTIYDVVELLKIEKFYVIGFDSQFMKKDEHHYHIHWASDANLEAWRKRKQKAMPQWGKSTKLYQAKEKLNSDPYAWFGYAVKELDFFHSKELNEEKLHNESIIQLAFKKSKLDWITKKEIQREEKKELKDKIFDSILADPEAFDDSGYLGGRAFGHIAPLYVKYYRQHAGKLPVKSVYESGTWEFLLDKCNATELDYVRFFSRNI